MNRHKKVSPLVMKKLLEKSFNGLIENIIFLQNYGRNILVRLEDC